MKARGARRFREQKWLLDSVVSTIGLDWDLLRMATVTAPIGFEGMGDWAVVAGKAKRFDDISPSFEEVAAGREARAREAEQLGNEVTARESYLVASIYYGVAQWPIDEINDRNLALNAKKLDCYARYAARAHHKIERIDIPMGKHILPAWLHLPVAGKPPYPLVIMLPGMDTFKEKLVWAYGDKMLARLCGAGNRRARAIRTSDARTQGDGRQLRRCRPGLHRLDRHAKGSRSEPDRCFWTKLRLLRRDRPLQRDRRAALRRCGRPSLFRTGLHQDLRGSVADLQESFARRCGR